SLHSVLQSLPKVEGAARSQDAAGASSGRESLRRLRREEVARGGPRNRRGARRGTFRCSTWGIEQDFRGGDRDSAAGRLGGVARARIRILWRRTASARA